MRKSEYEAMLVDDKGKIYDPLELDTTWKVLEALEEMNKSEKIKGETKKRGHSTLLNWLVQKRRV